MHLELLIDFGKEGKGETNNILMPDLNIFGFVTTQKLSVREKDKSLVTLEKRVNIENLSDYECMELLSDALIHKPAPALISFPFSYSYSLSEQ